MTAFANLPPLNCEVPAFYKESARVRNATIGLEADQTAVTASETITLDAMPATNCAATIKALPQSGESLHIISRGMWPAWDIVPTALRLAAPATITSLYIATLSMSRENVDQLVSLMDAKIIGRVCLIVSCYFRSTEADIVERIAREFEARGQRFAVRRCHAKLIAMEFSDGRCITSESSANLRSSRNIEHFAITHDRGLLDFHRGWMDQVCKEGDQR